MKDSKFLRIVIGLLGLALIVFVGAKARNSLEEYKFIGRVIRDRDTISISGEGKVTAKPDLAFLSLGVITDGSTVKEAQKKNTDKMNAIIAAVKDLGVESKDLQTTGYSINPRYDWNSGRQALLGYTVSQNIEVKVRDLDKAGDVLAKAGELGANQVGGIQFTIDEPKKLQDDARLKAIEDARKKAEALAKPLGLEIVKVVTFSESFGGYQPQPMFDRAKGMMPVAMEAVQAPTIESGSLDVTASVNVTFEVR